MNDHIDEITLRFLNHSILILSQTNVPEISCIFLLEKVSTCGK